MPLGGGKKKKAAGGSGGGGGGSKGRTQLKVLFKVTVGTLTDLPASHAGSAKGLLVTWKRGAKKENSGQTRPVAASSSVFRWDEQFSIKSTIVESKSKTKAAGAKGEVKYHEKLVVFSIVALSTGGGDAKKGKKTPVGSTTVDLGEISDFNKTVNKKCPVSLPKEKNTSAGYLMVTTSDLSSHLITSLIDVSFFFEDHHPTDAALREREEGGRKREGRGRVCRIRWRRRRSNHCRLHRSRRIRRRFVS